MDRRDSRIEGGGMFVGAGVGVDRFGGVSVKDEGGGDGSESVGRT